ncbi:MAG: autotransporter domain-containing protein [Sphingomonadaceae bacterium]|nr:autotransporter domain-containing protein [Sphingomonadaceae bacterium]
MSALRHRQYRRLAAGTALTLVAMAVPGAAQAACVQAGADITCSGNTTGPVSYSQDGVLLIVEATADVDGQTAGEAIVLTGNDNTIVNNGTVQTAADSRAAIRAVGGSGLLSINNSGRVLSTGNGFTVGLLGQAVGGDVSITNEAGGTIFSTNAGIAAFANAGSASVVNNGAITIGANTQFTGSAAGISVGAGLVGNTLGTNVATADNNGTIDADRTVATGISAFTRSGSQTLRNTGDISARDGILAEYTAADTSIFNSGSIDAAGTGIRTISRDTPVSDSSRIFVSNAGDLLAGDVGILVSLLEGQTAAIVNTGTIEAVQRAVNLGAATAASGISLENSGMILSRDSTAIDATLGGGGFSLINTGTIETQSGASNRYAINTSNSLDQVVTSGTINGNVRLGTFDDSFQVIGGSINGSVDGGDGTDSFTFDTAAAFTFANAIRDFETVTINGPVVFDGASVSGADSFNITTGGRLDIPTTSAIEATILAQSGTLALEPGAALTVTGDWVAQSGSTTIFAIDAAFPAITVSGDVTFEAGSVLQVDARNENLLANGVGFDAVVAGGSLTYAGGTVVDNSALFDFDARVIGGNTLRINAIQTLLLPDAVDPGDGNALGVATSLQDIVDSGSATGNQLATVLGQIADPRQLATAIDSFGPGESNAALLSTINAAELPFGAVQDRTDAVRGMGPALWGTLTIGDGKVNASPSLAGYDGKLTGLATGLDLWIGREGALRVGVGYAYADGSADETGNRATALDSTGHSVFAYLFEQHGKWRFAASLGYGWSSIDSARTIAPLGETASASYDAKSWFGRIEVGRTFATDTRLLMPYAALQVVDANVDGYDETGSPGALSVAKRSATSTRADLGLKGQFGNRKAGLSFIARAAMTHEMGDLAPDVKARFLAGGGPFATQVQDRSAWGGLAEGKLQWASGKNFTLQLGYQGRFTGDYQNHAGRLTLSWGF